MPTTFYSSCAADLPHSVCGGRVGGDPPTTAEAIVFIAKLGGYLARKSDGPPGTLVLWRGWKRLMDLVEGYDIATNNKTYG